MVNHSFRDGRLPASWDDVKQALEDVAADVRPDLVPPTEGSTGSDVAATEGEQPPELAVMASGCLGLISLPRASPGRLSLERIERLHPTLIEELRAHEGIGFLLVDSEADGALAIGS